MKRFTAILLVVAMLCSIFGGCGKKVETYTVNAYVSDDWVDVGIWAWSDSEGDLFKEWPGDEMKSDGNGWYSYDVPVWVDHVIINGYGGQVQTGDLAVAAQDLWIVVFSDSSASVTYLDPALHENPWEGCAIIGVDGEVYGSDSYESYDEPANEAPYVYEEPQQVDSGYIAELDGYSETVKLVDGSFTLNVPALCLYETVYNCTNLTVNMNVQMNAGTNCKDWQLWGRSGNTFVKLAKVYLPAGDGMGSQSVTFASPVTFDALVVTPTIPGGYSWSIAMTITDVWTK